MEKLITPPAITFPDFGPWLSYAEGIKSTTAIRRGIANIPTAAQYTNMVQVYHDFYVPICAHFGKVPVSSFFRSAALNRAIGGALNSAHMYGCAIDLDCDGWGHATNKQLFEWARLNLKFDQLILEAPDANNNPSWVHIAHNREGLADRGQVLRMIWSKGKQIYEII